MSLAKEDLEQIQLLVDKAISQAQINVEPVLSNVRYDLEIRDRTLKVEEELKHQRELMLQGFQSMEKRFEVVDKHFEAIDKRFEAVDKRFEAVDKRFEDQRNETNQRFEYMEKQFESIRKDMLFGFSEVNRHLQRFMFWTFGLITSVTVLFISFKLL